MSSNLSLDELHLLIRTKFVTVQLDGSYRLSSAAQVLLEKPAGQPLFATHRNRPPWAYPESIPEEPDENGGF